MNNIIIKLKRITAIILVLVVFASVFPNTIPTEAGTGTTSVILSNMGALGNVTIGSKSKSTSEKWWKMNLDGTTAFCMNLGYACHTGDNYSLNKSVTYSSDSSDRSEQLFAHIAYFWDVTSKGNQSKRRWQMTQSLVWAVQEGQTSKSKIIEIIQDVIDSGYSTTKSASEWYEEVLMAQDCTAEINIWTYTGSGSSRQQLIMFSAEKTEEPEYYSISDSVNYRQRLYIFKNDEKGDGIEGVTFTVEAKNIDEMYSYSISDDSGSSGNETDVENFDATVTTNSKGRLSIRFTYKLISESYYYIDDFDLADMSNSEKSSMKEKLDDMGYKYASDLSYDSAVELVEEDLKNQFDEINNKYIITEVSSASDDYYIDDEIATGITMKLDSSYSWLQNDDGSWDDKLWKEAGNSYLDWEYNYNLTEVNKWKKVKLNVYKLDEDSKGNIPQGDATLEGAVFGLYSDSSCDDDSLLYTYETEYDYDGEENYGFTTDYLRCGTTYYIKEISAPEGYQINDEVIKIKLDGSDYDKVKNVALETDNKNAYDTVIRGYLQILKVSTDGTEQIINPEKGAEFEVINNSTYSVYVDDIEYEAGEVVETIETDELGYAKTTALPYGTYTIHQISGAEETAYVDDFNMTISEDRKTYTVYLNNIPFKAYLKVIKIDGNTEQTVLKSGTTYQIYKYDEDTDTETLVTQSYSDGNSITNTSSWTTDESGIIMTYNPLDAGTYRIYEVEAAQGYAKSSSYVEIEITSSLYETYTDDATMTTYYYAEAEYVNYETYGKLGLLKTGEILTGFEALSDTVFTYEETNLSNATFEVYAAEDIYTQDNQGTTWFNEGDLVATITTGNGVTFTSECGGITGYEIDEETGLITMTLPLGTYTVKETIAPYGYVIDENTYTVQFTWDNYEDEYVIDSYSEKATDDDGILSISNTLAKGKVSIIKTDADTNKAIEGAIFGLYTANNIYAADGTLLAEADTLLDIVTTDENGYAVSDIELPLMSEGYTYVEETDDEDTDTADDSNTADSTDDTTDSSDDSNLTVSSDDSNSTNNTDDTDDAETDVNAGLNSGDYYFKEIFVSDSYYINEEAQYLHLEYADQVTEVIYGNAELIDKQTEIVIEKMALDTEDYLDGATLAIMDSDGNTIATWTTGDADSISISDDVEEMGYRNLSVTMDENGSVTIDGLLHDSTEYTLVETNPADGYVTAGDIKFMITALSDGSQVMSYDSDTETYVETGEYTVTMYDDITKVQISKVDITDEKELPGAGLTIYDEDGNEVETWTSTDEAHYIEMLPIGTYTLHEEITPDGYVTANDITFEVMDTAEIQTVTMVDDITKVEISKVDIGGEELSGAELTLYDEDGNVIDEWTSTDEAHYIEMLPVGTYTLHEVTAPTGYQVASDIVFTVEDTGEIQHVTMVDETEVATPKTGFIRTTIWYLLLTVTILTGMVFTAGIYLCKSRRKRRR